MSALFQVPTRRDIQFSDPANAVSSSFTSRIAPLSLSLNAETSVNAVTNYSFYCYFTDCALETVSRSDLAKAIREMLRLYKCKPACCTFSTPTDIGREDETSIRILRLYHLSLLSMFSPRALVGDGNCAYR